MGTVGCPLAFGFASNLEPMFAHDAFHPLVVDHLSLSPQLVRDASIAIPGILGCHCFNGLTHLLLICRRSAMVIGTPAYLHALTYLGDPILLSQHLNHNPFLFVPESH